MKTGSKFLGLCASIVCAGLVHAKGWWVPITVGVGPVSIVTTGSITYAEFQWGLVGCEEVASMGPVIRNGNNFSYNFELQKETGPGIFCPMIAMIETTTVALGTLAPGDYSFTITSWWNSVVTEQNLHRSDKLLANAPAHRFCRWNVSNPSERCHERELRPAMHDEFCELDFAFDQFSWAAVDGSLARPARLSLLPCASSATVIPSFGCSLWSNDRGGCFLSIVFLSIPQAITMAG